MSWQTSMAREFPEAVPQDRFVVQSYERLKRHGFVAENTIAFAVSAATKSLYPWWTILREPGEKRLYFPVSVACPF